MLFHCDSPEIPLQLFLLHKFRHNWAHQYLVNDCPDDKIPKDAHRAQPACAAEEEKERLAKKPDRRTPLGCQSPQLSPLFTFTGLWGPALHKAEVPW